LAHEHSRNSLRLCETYVVIRETFPTSIGTRPLERLT